MSATFDVIPVIEQGLDGLQDTHEVQLALTPNAQRLIERAHCRAVLVSKGREHPLPLLANMLAAGHPQINAEQNEALDAVMAAIGSSWATLTLSPDEATTLGHALLDAAEPPQVCADCNHLIDTDTAGTSCARCTETPRGRRAS